MDETKIVRQTDDSLGSHYSEVDMLNDRYGNVCVPIADTQGDRIDIELFIYGLTYRESVTLLFKALGCTVKDTAEILHLHTSRIYDLINRLEKKHNNIEYN